MARERLMSEDGSSPEFKPAKLKPSSSFVPREPTPDEISRAKSRILSGQLATTPEMATALKKSQQDAARNIQGLFGNLMRRQGLSETETARVAANMAQGVIPGSGEASAVPRNLNPNDPWGFEAATGRLPSIKIDPREITGMVGGGVGGDDQLEARYRQFFRLPPGMETDYATIDTQVGPLTVDVPASFQDKLDYIKKAVEALEATNEESGGLSVQERLSKAETLIKVLADPRYTERYPNEADENHNVAERLYAHLASRLNIHKAFLDFHIKADSVDQGKQAVDQVKSVALDELFSMPEFLQASQYFEDHGEDFFDYDPFSNPDEGGEDTSVLAERAAQAFRRKLNEEVFHIGGVDANYHWAQNLAERYWIMSTRRIYHAKIAAAKKAAKSRGALDAHGSALGRKKPDGSMEYKFVDQSAVRGTFEARKIEDYEGWAYTQLQGIHPFPQILKGFSFKEKGYVEDMITAFKSKKILPGETYERFDYHANDPSFWHRQENKFKTKMGEFAMSFWAFIGLQRPNQLREKMVGEPGSLLRNPVNEGVLISTNGAYDYMGADQWKAKEILTERVFGFMIDDINKETGKRRYTLKEIKNRMQAVTGLKDENGVPFISPEKGREIYWKLVRKRGVFAILQQMGLGSVFAFIFYYSLGTIQGFFDTLKKNIKVEV